MSIHVGDDVKFSEASARTEHSRSPSYPSDRLKLGMATVGFITLASAVALVAALPQKMVNLLEANGINELVAFPIFLAIYLVIMIPFDLLGGILLPRKHDKKAHTSISGYIKGGLIHGVLISISWFTLHLAGSISGIIGCLLAILILGLIGISLQFQIAELVGRLKVRASKMQRKNFPSDEARSIESQDPAFTGSIVGLPGSEKILMPSRWKEIFGEAGLSELKQRRMLIIQKGWRNRGLILSMIWILGSLFLSGLLVGFPDGSVESSINLILGTTIFNFIGLLILPTPSRNMTYRVDKTMQLSGMDSSEFNSWIQEFSELTDGEQSRHPWIERIFHPLPSVKNRQSNSSSSWAAWNATRTMLFLSIFSGGLLSRAVHCNVGRPDLWIIAPTD